MSAERAPEAIEAQAIGYWNSKKGRDFYAAPRPKEGYTFVPDKEIADIFWSYGRSFRIGTHEVLYADRRNTSPLTGIIVERSDMQSDEEIPLIAEVDILRDPLPLNALKRVIGVEPRAQFSLTMRVPESDEEVRGIINGYREFRAAQIYRDTSDGSYTMRMYGLNSDCNNALKRWGIESSTK